MDLSQMYESDFFKSLSPEQQASYKAHHAYIVDQSRAIDHSKETQYGLYNTVDKNDKKTVPTVKSEFDHRRVVGTPYAAHFKPADLQN